MCLVNSQMFCCHVTDMLPKWLGQQKALPNIVCEHVWCLVNTPLAMCLNFVLCFMLVAGHTLHGMHSSTEYMLCMCSSRGSMRRNPAFCTKLAIVSCPRPSLYEQHVCRLCENFVSRCSIPATSAAKKKQRPASADSCEHLLPLPIPIFTNDITQPESHPI